VGCGLPTDSVKECIRLNEGLGVPTVYFKKYLGLAMATMAR
jgi:hypothetical protein